MRTIINPKNAKTVIAPEIYGQFAEHLGHCIYGGVYVGEGSQIPNTMGIRNDVVRALRAIRVPVLRWPGGCFASEYHWRDGVGEKSARKKMVNNYWGGLVEDNSFGTHEFMLLCELIGCKPYITANVGSGTVQEMQEWVEYVTSNDVSPMADLRRKNGRDEAWKLPYLGIGNENWGGGGNMSAQFYADNYKRYACFTRSYSGNELYRIACGAGTSADDHGYAWTETLMREAGRHMNGLSLHYYTLMGDRWNDKGSATAFDDEQYLRTLYHAFTIDEILRGNEAIMDRYDRDNRVGLMVDEWGTWFDVEPGTNPGFLYQQNTMRDALVAGVNLNIFNNHARRVKMANIAQMVNVLQAMILTDGEKMLLTPTYHVFDLYACHQGARLADALQDAETVDTPNGAMPRLSVSASVSDQGLVNVTLAHTHPSADAPYSLRVDGGAYSVRSARTLKGDMHAMNTFDHPDNVHITPFDGIACAHDALGTELSMTLPACSVTQLTLEPITNT